MITCICNLLDVSMYAVNRIWLVIVTHVWLEVLLSGNADWKYIRTYVAIKLMCLGHDVTMFTEESYIHTLNVIAAD